MDSRIFTVGDMVWICRGSLLKRWNPASLEVNPGCVWSHPNSACLSSSNISAQTYEMWHLFIIFPNFYFPKRPLSKPLCHMFLSFAPQFAWKWINAEGHKRWEQIGSMFWECFFLNRLCDSKGKLWHWMVRKKKRDSLVRSLPKFPELNQNLNQETQREWGWQQQKYNKRSL